MPQADITFLCHHYEADQEAFSKIAKSGLKFHVEKHQWYREFSSKPLTAAYSGILCLFSLLYCALCRVVSKFGLVPKNVFHECDVVVDLNVDALNEYYLGIFAPIFVLSNILHGIVSGKPVVVCAASIVPFKSRSLRFLVRAVLNRTKLITVREEFSQKHLQDLGVTKPAIHLTADLAFLLEPCPAERIDEIMKSEGIFKPDAPLVGIIALRRSAFANPADYICLMAELSDALVRRLNATLLYIPYGPKPYDAKPTIQEIYQRIKTKHKVKLIRDDYPADELKGIISKCDIFISATFHPLVMSTSLAIPSVGLVAYHPYKFQGVIGKMMGQEQQLIRWDEFNDYHSMRSLVESKIRYVWENRDSIRETLANKAKQARQMALLNGVLIDNLIKGAR